MGTRPRFEAAMDERKWREQETETETETRRGTVENTNEQGSVEM